MTDDLSARLSAPLDDGLVRQHRGFDYMPAHLVIDQANTIFGYEGWSYEIVAQPTHNENAGGIWYTASVRVRAAGMVREDVGVGIVAMPRNGDAPQPAAHDTALKGAVSEALKRALRTFGSQFGNGLYGDGPQQPADRAERAPRGDAGDRAAPAPQPREHAQAASGKGNGAAASVTSNIERLVEWAAEMYGVEDGDAITGRTLLDALDERSWVDVIAAHDADWSAIAAAVKSRMDAAREGAASEAS